MYLPSETIKIVEVRLLHSRLQFLWKELQLQVRLTWAAFIPGSSVCGRSWTKYKIAFRAWMNEFVEFISLFKSSVLFVESQPRSMKQPDAVSADARHWSEGGLLVGESAVQHCCPLLAAVFSFFFFFYPVKAFVCESWGQNRFCQKMPKYECGSCVAESSTKTRAIAYEQSPR